MAVKPHPSRKRPFSLPMPAPNHFVPKDFQALVPSIREVRLIVRQPTGWSPGHRVRWAGRTYEVAESEDHEGYIHLTEILTSI